MGKAGHFRFDVQTDHVMCQPVDDKLPRKRELIGSHDFLGTIVFLEQVKLLISNFAILTVA